METLDAEIEGMANAKKKAKPQPKLLHLEEATSRHKQHITRLEQVCLLPVMKASSLAEAGQKKKAPMSWSSCRSCVTAHTAQDVGDRQQIFIYNKI